MTPARPLRLRPRAVSPLLLTCEHAGRAVPRRLPVDGPTRALLRTHRGWDIGIWSVTRIVSERLGATAVGGPCSRLVLDLNRDPGDPTLVVESADGTRVSFNADCGPDERARRVRALHVPYHDEVDRQCARLLERGLSPLLLSMHSFTPLLNPARRRFDVGVLHAGQTALARRLGRLLEAEGFSVRENRPYSAYDGLIYCVSRHGSRYGLPHLELEFNQRLLGTPSGCVRAGFRAARALKILLQKYT